MVLVKVNPQKERATEESDVSYLRSSYYLLAYMMTVNHTLFEEDRVNARHLKQVIAECMISTFKHR